MEAKKNIGGWQAVDIRDSFIMCPVASLPDPVRTEVCTNIGEYQLMFAQTMVRTRPEGEHVMLPDFLAKQPLHIFCTVVTNFDENITTLLDAVQHDRDIAQQELSRLKSTSNLEQLADTKAFLDNLNIIEKIARDGCEAPLAEDVASLVMPELMNGHDVASEKGVKYMSYKYDGFRPVL